MRTYQQLANAAANPDSKPDGGKGLGAATGSLKLYAVTIERVIVVMAKDERHAETEAEYYEKDEDGEPELIHAREISSVEELPPPWRHSIPWGGDKEDERTCAQRLSESAELRNTQP